MTDIRDKYPNLYSKSREEIVKILCFENDKIKYSSFGEKARLKDNISNAIRANILYEFIGLMFELLNNNDMHNAMMEAEEWYFSA